MPWPYFILIFLMLLGAGLSPLLNSRVRRYQSGTCQCSHNKCFHRLGCYECHHPAEAHHRPPYKICPCDRYTDITAHSAYKDEFARDMESLIKK